MAHPCDSTDERYVAAGGGHRVGHHEQQNTHGQQCRDAQCNLLDTFTVGIAGHEEANQRNHRDYYRGQNEIDYVEQRFATHHHRVVHEHVRVWTAAVLD